MPNKKAQLLIFSEETRGEALRKNLDTVGFRVVVKRTAHAGLAFAEKNCPDLVVVGSDLSDGTSFEICCQLRQLRYYVPIIVYVERADEYDRILALEVGADDYLIGTSNMREFVAHIHAQLRRAYEYSKQPDTGVLKMGEMVIDSTRGQAFCDRRLLDLTPIEFRLLKFLVQNGDQVVSRDQILDQIWGYGFQPYGDQMVNVHICRLRRKIEADPLRPALIITVRGLGYRLNSNPDFCAITRGIAALPPNGNKACMQMPLQSKHVADGSIRR